jgi:hypothetical protein
MSNYNPLKILIIIVVIIILIHVLYSSYNNNDKLLESYTNSNFTNKDYVDFDNPEDYDIHYLVEQMIYKEFNPSDKKKYLNLPDALKDSYIKEYLIKKI